MCNISVDRVLIYGSYSVLVHMSEENGKLTFSSTSFVLIVECSKVRDVFHNHGNLLKRLGSARLLTLTKWLSSEQFG